ncbi:DUF4190 domain-containing protein [Blastopirellula sp. JC732]|uniref:DUF4190 domain-containing protein n=1 Tax=Blastopirellula sediminis TaxID=2894196 RepID=A0A9X1MS34_9BACT|nr:DUF4190 domain-containing protein [Blastopirellula sediminis]MCC9605360.1 DUF4190 domain-containing protein [Blastopirellula sediminis]MCC9631340.1 DUF4190 domain-containing protein [Blastopirellula sediminis]
MANASDGNSTTIVVQPSDPNNMGLAGFIVSLVGLVSCGLLSPIGMVLSLFGMRKQPKGLAIAGFVMGLVGTILLVISCIFVAVVFLNTKQHLNNVHVMIDQIERTQKADELFDDFVKNNRRLPTQQEANKLLIQVDPDGKTLAYEPGERGTYTIVHAGLDGQLGTADDYRRPGFTYVPSEGQ